MKHQVISFSGGRSSAMTVLEVLVIHPDATILFMDTGGEHPDTYRFIKEFAAYYALNIICLRVVPDPRLGKASSYEVIPLSEIGPDLVAWRRMVEKYGQPYQGGAFCTDRMKLVPFTKYCNEHFGRGNYERWIGIRADEPKRLANRPDGFHYLADISDFDKEDVIEWFSDKPYDLRIPEHLGNCVFCIKKSLQKVALACKDEPDLAAQFITMLNEANSRQPQLMYRGNNTLQSIIAAFDETGRDVLTARVKAMRMYDTGSCSESCDAARVLSDEELENEEHAQ